MLGSLTPSATSITIIGGGISGLLLAYRAARLGLSVRLADKDNRFGGLIRTDSLNAGLSEGAANALLVSEPVRVLCKELSLPLSPLSREGRARYILRGGRLRRLPLTPLEFVQLAYRAALHRAGPKSPYHTSLPSPTFADFAHEFLTAPALDYLIDPGLTGIFAAAPSELSVAAIAPSLLVPPGRTLLSHLWGRAQGSHGGQERKRHRRYGMMVPHGGMESLITALVRELEKNKRVSLALDSELKELPDDENIALCVPAPVAAYLLQQTSSEAASALRTVRYVPLSSITVVLDNDKLAKVPRGTGVLIPFKEDSKILGVLFSSSSFPTIRTNPDVSIVRVLIGGTRHLALAALPEAEVTALATAELDQLFGLKAPPLETKVYHWPNAIPLYSPEILETWHTLETTWCARPGRILFGNYTGAVSIRGMIERVSQVGG